MAVDNAAIARRYLTEIWADHDLGVIDELVAPDIVLRDPMTVAARGLATFRDKVRSMAATFSDCAIAIEEIIEAGDRIVVRNTWRATHTGDFFGYAGSGKEIVVKLVDILRIRDGRVVENISSFDVYEMLRQLGALPPLGELAEVASPPLITTPLGTTSTSA